MHLMIFNRSFVANHLLNQQSLYLWEKCKSQPQSDITTCYKNDFVSKRKLAIMEVWRSDDCFTVAKTVDNDKEACI